mgnify:CR=1 FL=1
MSRGKIAVVHNLPNGGGKRLMGWTIKLFAKRGWKIDLFGPEEKNDKNPFKIDFEGIRFHPQPWMEPPLEKRALLQFINYQLPRYYRNLSGDMNNAHYSAVLIYSDWLTMAPWVLRFLSAPKIYIAYETKREFYEAKTTWPNLEEIIKQKMWKKLTRFIKPLEIANAKNADFIFTISKFAQHEIRKIYRHPQVYWHYPGIPPHKEQKPPKTVNHNYFLTIGAFTYLKGYDFLIKTIALLPKKWRLPLYAIGNTSQHQKYIKNLANKLKVEIHFFSNISSYELSEKLINTTIFLYAPRKEPLGLALLEGISYSIPTISINEGGPGEISNLLGIPAYPRQPLIFSRGIINLLTKYKSSKIKAKLIKNKMRFSFSLEKYVSKLEKIINHFGLKQ